MILPAVKSPLLESIVNKIFPDPISKRGALGRISLISFWILMGLVPFSILLVNRPGKVWVSPKAEESCVPQGPAFLTNVHSRGFSVFWITAGNCATSVGYADGLQGDDRTVTASLPQGNPTWVSSTGTHHITLSFSQRPSSGQVEIGLKSGNVTYRGSLENLVPVAEGSNPNAIVITIPSDPAYNSAEPPSLTNTPGAYSTEKDAFSECPNGKLAASCSGTTEKLCAADSTLCCNKACFRPYPIWGEIKDSHGTPIEGALVLALIPANSSGISSKLSTLTNSQGRWTLELANLHKTVAGIGSAGSTVSAEFFAYNTDRDANGQVREPDKVMVGATAPKVGSNIDNPTQAPLHSVTNTQSCSTRNTCASHPCAMENPSPICITLGQASGPPTCTSFTLDKATVRPDESVTATIKVASGSSPFATDKIALHAVLPPNPQGGLGRLSTCAAAGCSFPTFTPQEKSMQAGTYQVWLSLENTQGLNCTDKQERPAGVPACGCGIKELIITAADTPQISDVRPNRGLRGTEVNVTITGSKLHPEVTYKLSRGSDNINGTVNATPAPSATSINVKFNIPASTTTGNWNLVATKGTSTASFPFIIVDSTETTVVTFFVELQGLDKSTSPRRQLKVNIGDQDYVVESIPQAQGRYVGAFVLPSSVTGSKEFKVWEPEVRLKRKFTGSVTSGDVNYYDWTGRKILAGDFDGNNKITLADFTGPQGILKPLQTGNKISLPVTDALKKYDVNGDNALNVLDISLVLLNFSGLEVPGE